MTRIYGLAQQAPRANDQVEGYLICIIFFNSERVCGKLVGLKVLPQLQSFPSKGLKNRRFHVRDVRLFYVLYIYVVIPIHSTFNYCMKVTINFLLQIGKHAQTFDRSFEHKCVLQHPDPCKPLQLF